MKTVCSKCNEPLERTKSFKNPVCFNCKRKRRIAHKKKGGNSRCDICWKTPKCFDWTHWNLRYWLFFNEKGEAELSEAGKKKLGKDYLENLRKHVPNTL